MCIRLVAKQANSSHQIGESPRMTSTTTTFSTSRLQHFQVGSNFMAHPVTLISKTLFPQMKSICCSPSRNIISFCCRGGSKWDCSFRGRRRRALLSWNAHWLRLLKLASSSTTSSSSAITFALWPSRARVLTFFGHSYHRLSQFSPRFPSYVFQYHQHSERKSGLLFNFSPGLGQAREVACCE